MKRLLRAWIPHSAGVRFAAIYAALFGASALALALFLWWATAGLLERQVAAAIGADMQGLNEQWEEGGLPALILTIRDRLAENIDDDAIYLLVDGRLHPLAGNLARWPLDAGVTAAWFEVSVLREGVRSPALLHRVDLPGGYRLLVGRDIQARARLRRLLTDALLWSVLVVGLLGSAGALLIRSLFRRTLANVSRTTEAISAGDLTRRVPLSGRDDEFDRLAETINDMLERIARLMDGVKQVSNAIAHDLRTPITRARTRLEDAALHAEGEAALRAAIERGQADLDGIVGIFQALLRIAEIEAGARRSAFAPLDFAVSLADLAELYGVAAEEAGLRLEFRCAASLPLLGDRNLLQQAMANLLDNAIKFSPPGGVILLEGRLDADIQLIVADGGPGIPPEDRLHATDRFFRGERARSTPGSGLGLALVQAVAQLHGGRVELADNAPGLYAAIVLPLPGPLAGG